MLTFDVLPPTHRETISRRGPLARLSFEPFRANLFLR